MGPSSDSARQLVDFQQRWRRGDPVVIPDGATCHVGGQCRCGRAAAGCSARALERMAHRKVTGAKHVPCCLINSGAYLVRNTARARARVKWWAERDGCEMGTLGR
jgi:hypothetical protein